MSLIRVKDIRKVYRVDKERVVALNRINLEIETGEIYCILGTSGCGGVCHGSGGIKALD